MSNTSGTAFFVRVKHRHFILDFINGGDGGDLSLEVDINLSIGVVLLKLQVLLISLHVVLEITALLLKLLLLLLVPDLRSTAVHNNSAQVVFTFGVLLILVSPVVSGAVSHGARASSLHRRVDRGLGVLVKVRARLREDAPSLFVQHLSIGI